MSTIIKKGSGFSEAQSEILKCGKDPVYFLKKYFWIQSKQRTLFKTFPFQEECLDSIRNNKYVVINKSRQLGLSTLVAGYAVWLALFRRDSNILVIATKLNVAKNFIKKCKFGVEHLPTWLRICGVQCNIQNINFENGSEIKAIPTSDDAGRSEALTLLIIDEAAHIQDFDTLWTGLLPTLSYSNGRAVLISSPLGTGNLFYKICTNAQTDPDSEFKYIELPWHVHPERDEEWFRKETKKLSQKQVAQEYECSFNASGETFLDSLTLENLKNAIKKPKERWHADRNLWVWEIPKEGHKYIIPADTATGEARDYSAFHVIDQSEGEVVAEYIGKEPTDRFAELLNQVGLKYNTAIICPENNSYGYSVIQDLRKLRYPKLYRKDTKSIDWSPVSIIAEKIKDYGINMHGENRPVLLSRLEEVLRNSEIKIYSSRTHEQLMTFIFRGSQKLGAANGKNDDLVISLAIGIALYEAGSLLRNDEDMTKAKIRCLGISSIDKNQIMNTNKNEEDYRVLVPTMADSLGLSAGTHEQRMSNKFVVNKNWSWLYK